MLPLKSVLSISQFLGFSLVGLKYEIDSILDAHADKKRGTERVHLTFGPERITCTGKKKTTVSYLQILIFDSGLVAKSFLRRTLHLICQSEAWDPYTLPFCFTP